MATEELEYVGFWARLLASLIDSVLAGLIILPIVTWVYGADYWTSTDMIKGPVDLLMQLVFPAVAVVAFWMYRQASPGKMAIGAKIVDAKTGGKPSNGQLILRYFGYFVSTIPALLGLIWVGLDARKQGWHDKLAGTVVVRAKARGPQPVRFDAG